MARAAVVAGSTDSLSGDEGLHGAHEPRGPTELPARPDNEAWDLSAARAAYQRVAAVPARSHGLPLLQQDPPRAPDRHEWPLARPTRERQLVRQ